MATTLNITPEVIEAVVEKSVTEVTVSTRLTGPLYTWFDYVSMYSTIPTKIATIPEGDVYQYEYGNDTLYRLVPSGELNDSFYTSFQNNTLSGLVSERILNL